MNWLERVHERSVAPRRVRVLAEHVSALLPDAARVLDVGCGDGRIAREIARRRPDVALLGIDVLVRPDAHIAVEPFDGTTIPAGDGEFDAVLLLDVLHHAREPATLLQEAVRVTRGTLVVKDHLREGRWAGPTLRFMDRVGNRRHGVRLDCEYWTHETWRRTFDALRLDVASWTTRLPDVR